MILSNIFNNDRKSNKDNGENEANSAAKASMANRNNGANKANENLSQEARSSDLNKETIEKLSFDSSGLIPVVVQDFFTREVLTVAYMNKESLRITIDEGRTCFYSRSRQQLWRKGEESGNVQHVVRIVADCDYDALVVEVIKDGPACHLGKESCFATQLYKNAKLSAQDSCVSSSSASSLSNNKTQVCTNSTASSVLENLYALLIDRKKQRPQGSYTTYLFDEGVEKILKKVGEEATEVIIASMKNAPGEVIYEIADLCYHVLVLMIAQDISLDAVRTELANRHVIDKKEKQKTSSAAAE